MEHLPKRISKIERIKFESKFLSKFIIKNTDLNLQDIDISNRIEKLLKDLDSYSFFVSNEHKKSAILDVSDKRSKKSYRLRIYDRLFAKLKPSILDFFVLSASRSAIKIAENVANNLSKNKDIKESYDFKYEKDDEDYFALFNRKTTYPSNT